MPKTLFLFKADYFKPEWFELEGDYSHLNKVYLNAVRPEDADPADWKRKQEELSNLLYGADAYEKLKVTFIAQPTKDWDYFVECGFLP